MNLSAMGFDPAKLRFAFRTAVVACVALLLAQQLGLEHPQWSAMTVWITAQPTRGLLMEKAAFRVGGTILGTAAGVALTIAAHGQPWLLVAGLAVWLTLCSGVGNLLHGMASYGAILAGYSASMVALLDTAHPDSVWATGADRLGTILVGVLLATVVGLLTAPSSAAPDLADRLKQLVDKVRAARRQDTAGRYGLLSEMAALEESLGPHGAGSMRGKASARAARSLLMALLQELLVRPEAPSAVVDQALEGYLAASAGKPSSGSQGHPVLLHRDWIAARWAMARTGLTILLAGGLWAATGWHAGTFLLLGVSAMITLFSTFENPVRTMRFVILGQVYGALAALACRFLAWPLAHNEVQVALLTMPFILAGALFFSHRRTVALAFDYAMVSLILLHPVYPLEGDFADMAGAACAVVLAPTLALVMYRIVFPIDTHKRLANVMAMMIREVRDMAGDPWAHAHAGVWRARLYHRLLRLTRLAELSATDRRAAVDFGTTVMDLGDAVFALRRVRPGLAPDAIRAVDAVLQRLVRLSTAPRKAAAALSRAGMRLARAGHGAEAQALERAARALAEHADLF